MLIVGGSAALIAIAAWLVSLAVRSWRARQRAKAHDYRNAREHEDAHSSF
jgi:hypothetical protein